MKSTLLIFDVDSVLINPLGYRVALRATIDHFVVAMGQPPLSLTLEENALFEASGITSEWDSAPMCIGAYLVDALIQRPDLVRASFAATVDAIRQAGLALSRPDVSALARAVLAATPDGEHPTRTIHDLLRQRMPQAAHHLLDELFMDNYTLKSPVTAIFQQFVLGSEHFTQTYGQPAAVEAESALVAHDLPLLEPALRDRLLAHIDANNLGAAIFTARPSRPPANLPSMDTSSGVWSPDGDMAAHQLGLDGHLPLIGVGQVAWLAAQRGRDVASYIKPSPVQALAAIGAAASGDEVTALEAAAHLYEAGLLIGPLAGMAGQGVRVVVFEDSVGGTHAVRKAIEVLQRAGLDVTCEANGIATEPSKREQLMAVADHIFDDINQALRPYLTG